MHFRSLFFLPLFIIPMLVSCGGDKPPFEAEYISPNEVRVTYRDATYTLNRFGPQSDVPFRYSFESDGDLDIVIDGREWEVDSPYDRDAKKTKKKKKNIKKKKK